MKLRNMASVYITHGDEILLLYRQGSRVVNNTYIASDGGHFEKEELNAPKECVLRELKDKNLIGESDEGKLKWVKFGEALSYNMPFTAYGVVEHYLSIGKDTNDLYAGTTMESGMVFHELKEFEDK